MYEEGYVKVASIGGNVEVNHYRLVCDENEEGFACFSPAEAMNLAYLLLKHARLANIQHVSTDPCPLIPDPCSPKVSQ